MRFRSGRVYVDVEWMGKFWAVELEAPVGNWSMELAPQPGYDHIPHELPSVLQSVAHNALDQAVSREPEIACSAAQDPSGGWLIEDAS